MYLSSTPIDAPTSTFTAPALTRAAALHIFEALASADDGKGESPLQRWSSTIGIVTAIVGNILISFALNIQRFAHIQLHKQQTLRREKSQTAINREAAGYGTTSAGGVGRSSDTDEEENLLEGDGEEQDDSNYLMSPYWWGGIVLMTVGEAGNFLAYGFAPASIVSPLGVVALVANCVIAPIMLKERFRLRDFWGVVVAVAGAVTVVLSAKQEEKRLGPHEILHFVTRTEFEVYMAVTATLIIVLMWASPRYGEKTILVDLGLVGLFGGYTALSTKGVASMLSSTLWRAFTAPVTYVLLAILMGTAVMQVKYVNKALQRFDSTQVIPVQFVMFTLSVIIGSAILYRDFEKAEAGNMVKFVWGCLFTFFGVYLITSGRQQINDDEEEDSYESGDETISLADQEQNEHVLFQAYNRHGLPVDTGDAANDTEVNTAASDSRRSSRASVSFAESSRPHTARLYSKNSLRGTPRSSQPSGSEETPLLRNPWKTSSDDLLSVAQHPGLHSTISSPILQSEAQTLDAPKPPNLRSATHDNMHTHPNLQKGPAVPQADPVRPFTPVRHSISRMMPGPLLSPLSGGLSVIVADSLRRGVEVPSRRPSKHLRRSKSSSQSQIGIVPSDDVPSEGEDIDTSTSIERERAIWAGVTRARSLSNTLGDFLKGKRHRAVEESTEENVGPNS